MLAALPLRPLTEVGPSRRSLAGVPDGSEKDEGQDH